MKQDRRNFLKGAGALTVTHAETKTSTSPARGMPKGLTLLTMRRNGEYALGVKTERGILDVQQTSKQLRMTAPATMDDLLQNEQGPALMALVSAALKPGARTTFRRKTRLSTAQWSRGRKRSSVSG